MISLDRDDKAEAMRHHLWPDVMRIILKDISNMCVRALRVSPVSAINSYQQLCRLVKNQCYSRPSYISSERKET